MKTFAFLRTNRLYDEYKKMGITGISCGKYNGYVGIIDGNSVPLSCQGKHSYEDYDKSLDSKVDIHTEELPLMISLMSKLTSYHSPRFLPIGGNTESLVSTVLTSEIQNRTVLSSL